MTKEEFYRQVNIDFSSQQRNAIEAVNGPVLLLAVPGSGKTTVLVARLGYMILCKVIDPADILVLTYTVAAAADMKRRFEELFGEDLAERLEFRTINGICAKVILSYGSRIGKQPFELISDEKYTAAVIADIYRDAAGEYPTEGDIKGVKAAITYIKNMMLDAGEIKVIEKDFDFPVSEIYKRYNEVLKKSRSMDYDDQLVYAYKLLQADINLLTQFRNNYKYICVDEAQDTSRIQHAIIALLAKPLDNLFMVGDEDQSIYGFRAAYPDALISFERDHSNAKVLLMETNYRSAGNIVSAADSFIQQNTMRHKKGMKASRAAGKDIKAIETGSLSVQYGYILKAAGNLTEKTAVLYRDNESAIPLADILERNNVPFRIRTADYTFFSHRIVSDIKSILKFAYNQYDSDLFMQIYYKLDLFVNKQAAQDAVRQSAERDITILDALQGSNMIQPFTKSSVRKVQTHLHNLRSESAGKALYRIADCCGYNNYLERNHLSKRKIDILKSIANKEASAEAFLARLDYLERYLRTKDVETDSKLILSTIHSSKGLEYDTVYLIDIEDGIFPESVPANLAKMSTAEAKAYEEERRLFYVGITRAKKNLVLFRPEHSLFADQLLGKRKSAQKSEFSVAKSREVSAEVQKLLNSAEAGAAIIHKKFGPGVIKSIGSDLIEIEFANGDTKKFAADIIARSGMIIM